MLLAQVRPLFPSPAFEEGSSTETDLKEQNMEEDIIGNDKTQEDTLHTEKTIEETLNEEALEQVEIVEPYVPQIDRLVETQVDTPPESIVLEVSAISDSEVVEEMSVAGAAAECIEVDES